MHFYKDQLLVVGGRTLVEGEPGLSMSIYSINLIDGCKVTEFAQLPTPLCSHSSSLVSDRYLIVYGGTNGAEFFNSLLRLDLETKKWTLWKAPIKFTEGRIGTAMVQVEGCLCVFGGSAFEADHGDVMVISGEALREDGNFGECVSIL